MIAWLSMLKQNLFGNYEDVKVRQPDISKAKRDLKHNPEVPLEEGIPRTIDWMKEVYRPIKDE